LADERKKFKGPDWIISRAVAPSVPTQKQNDIRTNLVVLEDKGAT